MKYMFHTIFHLINHAKITCQSVSNYFILDRKYRKQIFTCNILLFFLFLGLATFPEKAMAKTTTVQITTEDGATKNYSNTGQIVTLDGNTISTKNIPSVKINSKWMVSVREVFEEGLGCTYTQEKQENVFTLTNPNTDEAITFTVGSKNVTFTENNGAMPNAAVQAINLDNGESGILVPASYVAKKLGFTCSYQTDSKTLTFKTITFLDKDVKVPDYDTTLYSNVLTTAYLRQNSGSTREVLDLITSFPISPENIKIVENEDKGKITYTLLNTFNAVGNMEKSYNTAYVKTLSIATSGRNIVVTMTYKSKYSYMSTLEEDMLTASFSSATYSMKIRLPETITFSKVTHEDQYYNNQFLIQIPGDWEQYYEENPIITNNNVIKKVSVETIPAMEENSSNTDTEITQILVKTKKLQGYKLTEKKGYFLVQIGNPKKIYDRIVVLDAGHGGKDDGATNNGTKEKDLNYKMIYSLAKEYFDRNDSKVKAYWTRTDDTFITLSNRAKFASKVGADLFVSLHMNSCTRSSVNGMEVYYSKDNNKTMENGLTSRILARKMLNTLKGDLNASSRGVKSAGFYVIKHNTVPAILVELGFLSGSSDYQKLTSGSYQKKAAKSIYQCIENIFETYPTGR